jgi:hypothetical protein
MLIAIGEIDCHNVSRFHCRVVLCRGLPSSGMREPSRMLWRTARHFGLLGFATRPHLPVWIEH